MKSNVLKLSFTDAEISKGGRGLYYPGGLTSAMMTRQGHIISRIT